MVYLPIAAVKRNVLTTKLSRYRNSVNIVIVGAGIRGYHIADLLSREEHNVIVIDETEASLSATRRYLDVKTIQGGVASPRILREAEVHKADLLIAITDNDETNMITCFMGRALGVKRTVARVRNPEYAGYMVSSARSAVAPRRIVRPETLGINLFVNPDVIAAQEIRSTLSGLHTTPMEEFAEGRVQAREFRVTDDSLIDKTIEELPFSRPCCIAAIIRADQILIPERDEILREDDRIWILAARDAMDEIANKFTKPHATAKRVIILGAEFTGIRLAQSLHKRGVHIKIMDPNEELCQKAAAQLEHGDVVMSAGNNSDALVEEGVTHSDAFITTTSNDELNILVSLLAKSLGTKRSIAMVEKPQYVSLAEALGVDAAVSPLLLTVGKIARLVRSASVMEMSFLSGTNIEAIGLTPGRSSEIANKPLKELALPKEAHICALVRDDKVIITEEKTVIKPTDYAIVIGLPAAVHSVEKLFE